jgi:hypothetical protein
MGNPPNHHGIRNVDDAIQCFESQYGNRDIEIRGNAAISNFSISFDGYSGNQNGDNYAWYTVTWNSNSSDVLIKLAGRAAGGQKECGYGACYGAGDIGGNPYHFKLETLDNHSLGNRDNQLQLKPYCDVEQPVTFGIPRVNDACDPNPTIAVIDTESISYDADGAKIHCRTWRASDDCGNSTECTQCITVTCGKDNADATGKWGEEEVEGLQESNFGDIMLRTYPNPSNSKVNFDLVFNKDMEEVTLEMFNLAGQKVAEPYHGSVLEEANYHFEFDASNLAQGTYFYRLTAGGTTKTGKVVIIR